MGIAYTHCVKPLSSQVSSVSYLNEMSQFIGSGDFDGFDGLYQCWTVRRTAEYRHGPER